MQVIKPQRLAVGNPANLQYFASYFFGDGYSVGTSPNMLVHWYATKGENKLTFSIGLSLSKVQRLGILPELCVRSPIVSSDSGQLVSGNQDAGTSRASCAERRYL
jgi:hypothetical protein